MAKPPSDDLLYKAAELRAGGSKWETVAKALHRSIDTVREWPRRYRDRWAAVFRIAERSLVSDVSAESILVLRTLLRSEDEKVRRDAANSLMSIRIDLAKHDRTESDAAPNLSPDTARLAAFLEGRPDDELARVAAQFTPAATAQRTRDLPCPVDGAA
jgi:transposase